MRHNVVPFALLGALALGALAAAQNQGVQAIIGNVFLQDTTPGEAQIGHANIKGTFRAGQVNVTSLNATIPFIGNNNGTSVGAIGASFSSAGRDGIAARGTATNSIGFGRGLFGESRGNDGVGVQGHATTSIGVEGRTFGTNGVGVRALSQTVTAPALQAWNLGGGIAARFDGDLQVFNSQGEEVVKTALKTDGGFFIVKAQEFNDNAGFQASTSVQAMSLVRNSNARVINIIGSNGVGSILADEKNFVQPDPDDPNRDIVYACVEGPEAAAYIRGTARLVGGVCRVALPRHFQNVAVPEGMTVQLTPRSPESEGLCVSGRSMTGFEVKELRRGRGTYEFDWEVKAVRRGFVDYKVYRPWDANLPADSDRGAALAGRLQAAKKVYGIEYAVRP